jgi:hypothetical protein
MWAYDAFRIADVVPPDTELYFSRNEPFEGVGEFYRSKGNVFSELMALLLQNRTSQEIGARSSVQGFSQRHQIDVAWPERLEDTLVCAETKVTGAPPAGKKPARSAFPDFSNRRKELKFAATDLKLYRRDQKTRIGHWDVWRGNASPRCYFLWAARLSVGELKRDDTINQMVSGARALIETYLDGAGVFAWRLKSDHQGYEAVPLTQEHRVTDLDDVLHRIATEIEDSLDERGQPPPPRERKDEALPQGVLEAPAD